MIAPVFLHIGLNCREQATTAMFYEKHFGFKETRSIDVEGGQIVFLRSDNIYLELFQAKGTSPEPPYQNDGPPYAGFRHIAFQVDNVDEKLNSMGKDVIITLGPMNFDDFIKGWRTVWIKDPDGRIIELSQGYTD